MSTSPLHSFTFQAQHTGSSMGQSPFLSGKITLLLFILRFGIQTYIMSKMLEKFCRPQLIRHSGKLTIHTTYMCMCNVHGGNIVANVEKSYYLFNKYLSSAHITGIPAVVSTSTRGVDANPKHSRNGEWRRRQQGQQLQQHGGN